MLKERHAIVDVLNEKPELENRPYVHHRPDRPEFKKKINLAKQKMWLISR